jgi:hypothetical protein
MPRSQVRPLIAGTQLLTDKTDHGQPCQTTKHAVIDRLMAMSHKGSDNAPDKSTHLKTKAHAMA